MQVADLNNPNDRKKLILAAVLGLIAILFLWWTFFGFGSSKPTTSPRSTPLSVNTTTNAVVGQVTKVQPRDTTPSANDLAELMKPIVLTSSIPRVPEPKRNIFAFYEPPQPTPKQTV